jgi:sulfur carrier protein
MIELRINGESRSFDVAPLVSDILDSLGLTGKRVALERNGAIVPKSLHGSTRCAAGDVIEIVVAVGGG